MSPRRRLVSDEAKVVHLAQQFKPSFMREYLLWTDIWRRDPQNGRGLLRGPVDKALKRGAGIFWEPLDADRGRVQCFLAPAVRAHLEARLQEDK
jgi:hypothetical protein